MALNLLEVGAVGDRSEPMIELCDYITSNSEVNSAIDLFAGNANDNGSFVSWKLYDICKDVTFQADDVAPPPPSPVLVLVGLVKLF